MTVLTADAEHCKADSEVVTLAFLLGEGCVLLSVDMTGYTVDNGVLTADMEEICGEGEEEVPPPVVEAPVLRPFVTSISVVMRRRKRLIRRGLLLG